MPKVSVVTPVYGVEAFIERCARSLFEQTLDDMEFLFIDDCTPDKSIDVLKTVLEDYPQRKEQVFFHKMEKNSGQAAVRQWGILNATGDYVIHCDSDDWVDVNMYKMLYETAIKDNADVVISDYYESDSKNINNRYKGCKGTEVSSVIDDILFRKVHSALWNKLFRRELYSKGIDFPKGNLWEDMAIVIQLLLKCDTVSYIPEPYYYYYFNPSSIINCQSKEKNIRNFLSERDNLNIVINSLANSSWTDKYSDNIVDLKFHTLHLLFPYTNDKECYEFLLSSYPKMTKVFLLSKNASFRYKMGYLLALMRIYPYLGKLFK